MNYEFKTTTFRAQCLYVVDGDTVDLLVDQAFHSFKKERFRLYGVDTPELRSSDPLERAKALEAKAFTIKALSPVVIATFFWSLRIETFKNPDSFGRYLALIYYKDENGVECELGAKLVERGLAVIHK